MTDPAFIDSGDYIIIKDDFIKDYPKEMLNTKLKVTDYTLSGFEVEGHDTVVLYGDCYLAV